jgi:outer membrane lipoprotein-sorting protein
MKVLKVIWIVMFGLFINYGNAQDLDEVLQAHYEAINQEALSKVENMHITGKSGRMGQEFNFEIWQQRPNKFRMEVDIQGQKMIQLYDGEKAYMVAPWTGTQEAQELGETETEQMQEQADMDGDLWNWKEKGSKLSIIGTEDFEGSEVIILEVIKKNGNKKTYYIDADSYLPIKVSSKIQMQGSEVQMEAFMSNYKEVNGMVVAHYVENRMNGDVMSTITIETVEFDADIPTDKFVKPTVEK